MRQVKLLMTALLLIIAGRAFADNLTLESISMKAGETKQAAISLTNPDKQYVAFQFDLVLPDGVTVATNNKGKLMASLDAERMDDHTLNISDMGGNTYRLLAFSMSNAEFYGQSGALVHVTLKADESASLGGKKVMLKSQVFTDSNGNQVKWSDASFDIQIKTAVVPEITADNKSREYGEENPAFTYKTSSELNGTPSLTTSATKTSPVGEYEIVVGKGTIEGEYTSKNGKLTVTKAPLTIKAQNYTITQGEPLPNFVVEYAGFKNNETENVLTKKPSLSTSATSGSAPGRYDITVSGAEAQNYSITYAKGTLTIVKAEAVVVTAKSYTREYGDANPAFEYTSSGATLKGRPDISCEATATSPVGTYPIVIRRGSVTNYNDEYVNGTLTITKAPLSITAKSYTRKQGEENPTLEVEYSGFKNNETETVLAKKPTVSTKATVNSEPGKYEITVSGAEAQNYEITYKSGELTVIKTDAVVVTAKSYTREYGDANPVFEYTSSGATLNGRPDISCEATVTSPVGTYPIVISKGSVTNYNDEYVNGTLTITKAPLTVTAMDASREQFEDNPEFAIVYSGWKNGEDENVLIQKAIAVTDATKDSEVGQYVISVSGGEAQNYELHYVNGVLTVTESTGMAGIVANGEPFDVYNLQGRKLARGITTLRGLPKGVYIIKGRKVVR